MKKQDQYKQIWMKYRKKLILFVRSFSDVLYNEAEDLAEEILLKVFQKLDAFSAKYSFSTWLYSIARNHCIDYLRRESRDIPQDHNSQLQIWRGNPEKIFLQSYEEAQVSKFINNLEARDYRISFLRFYEEMPVKEIALVMKMPLGTVKYRIHEIKKNLKDYLEGENEREEKYSRT